VQTIRRIVRSTHVICGALLSVLVLGAIPASAQNGGGAAPEDRQPLRKGAVEIGGIFGSTLPVSWLRAHPDRHITMGSLDIGRIMTGQVGHGPLAGQFEFLLEITPVLLVYQPSHAFGLATSPLHMRWNLAPGHRLRPFTEVSGGIVFTNEPVPARTTRFNFIDQAGFGLRWETSARLALLAGYRFQHISNAGRVKPNPGVNFNLVYGGVTLLR
jgi:lipid A 3-O-deacylase